MFFVWKNKKRMVGLGQGAQIGNFAGDGTEKQIQFGRSKRKWQVWGRAPGLGACWGWNLKADLIWKIKKKMVGLGQGARIENFAGYGIEKQV